MTYSPETAAEFYNNLYREEIQEMKKKMARASGAQIAAAKGRAAKKFKKAEREYWSK